MTDPKQIPHLIKLLDDESSNVREVVSKELSAFGPMLKDELERSKLQFNSIQRENIEKILDGHRRIWLKQVWPEWINGMVRDSLSKGNYKQDYQSLESALSILSEFLNRAGISIQLSGLLDELAAEYQTKFKINSAVKLAKFFV